MDEEGYPLEVPDSTAVFHVEDDSDFTLGLPVYLDSVGLEVLAAAGDLLDTAGFDQATSGPISKRWWDSMRLEIEDLIRNGTWKLVSRKDTG